MSEEGRTLFSATKNSGVWAAEHHTQSGKAVPVACVMVPAGRITKIFPDQGREMLNEWEVLQNILIQQQLLTCPPEELPEIAKQFVKDRVAEKEEVLQTTSHPTVSKNSSSKRTPRRSSSTKRRRRRGGLEK